MVASQEEAGSTMLFLAGGMPCSSALTWWSRFASAPPPPSRTVAVAPPPSRCWATPTCHHASIWPFGRRWPEAPEGLERGYFVRPTVLSAVRPMVVAGKEIFGPVLVILAHDGDDDAVRIANDSIYGLDGGVVGCSEAVRLLSYRTQGWCAGRWSGDRGRSVSRPGWR